MAEHNQKTNIYRHRHRNLFPPTNTSRANKHISRGYKDSYEEDLTTIPMIRDRESRSWFVSDEENPAHPSFPQSREKSTRPPSTVPGNLTSLLQEVLSVMDTVMASHSFVQAEDAILSDLTEMVITLQEEAEDLIEMADLVEDYVEEIEMAVMIDDWMNGLGIVMMDEAEEPGAVRRGKELESDSGIGLDDETDGVMSTVSGSGERIRKSSDTRGLAIPLSSVRRKMERDPSPVSGGYMRKSSPSSKNRIVLGAARPRKGKQKEHTGSFRDSALVLASPPKSRTKKSSVR